MRDRQLTTDNHQLREAAETGETVALATILTMVKKLDQN